MVCSSYDSSATQVMLPLREIVVADKILNSSCDLLTSMEVSSSLGGYPPTVPRRPSMDDQSCDLWPVYRLLTARHHAEDRTKND